MNNTFSKSSAYIDSLVDFTLDTKPYHTKLTQVAVEYRFEDTVNVSIVDAVASRMITKAGWLYNYFSGGDVNNRTLSLKRLELPHVERTELNSQPAANPGAFKVGRDENTDMAQVPYVYDKRSTVGIADAWVERGGINAEYLTSVHDFARCYGSMQFRVSAASPTDADQSRRWQETKVEDVMSLVNSNTRYLANQRIDETQPWSPANSHPNSANFRIRALLNAIAAQLVLTPNAAANLELDKVLAVLNTPDLPQTYEALWAALEGGSTPPITNPVTGQQFTGWRGEDGFDAAGNALPEARYVDDAISQHTPPAYFNTLSDLRSRNTGAAVYASQQFEGFTVYDIEPVGVNIDEWTLTVSADPTIVNVSGKMSGPRGAFIIGQPFETPFIKFKTSIHGTAVPGASYLLTPVSSVVIADDAPLEVWNIIKSDPRAFTRPAFTSTRYGYIVNQTGDSGQVTILDSSLPQGTIVLTATNATTFALTSTAEAGYTGTVQVDVPFNDGRIAFTIRSGTVQPFVAGDRFYINIKNAMPEARGFDLYYGYDLDSLENQTVVYENQDATSAVYQQPLDFLYDTRFTDYDLTAFDLQIAQNSPSGVSYRLIAVPDGAPINVIHSDGSGPSNYIDLAAPGGTGVPVFSMPDDPDTSPDLAAYYANSFKLEKSLDGGVTWSVVAPSIPIGTSFSSAADGISFTVAEGSKPFIAVKTDGGVEGGDVFAWTVINDPAVLDPSPVIFASVNLPRLIMHASNFWNAPDARWTVAFTSSSEYTVTAIYTSGPSTGSSLTGYPTTGNLDIPGTGSNRNLTYRDDLVHFTIMRGRRGFAAGDAFTFDTTDKKPSLLVHGSVSGWQDPAEIGEWYWNGKIGFKIDAPKTQLFQNNQALTGGDALLIDVARVRPDTPPLVYTFRRVAVSPVTFEVTRSDVGSVGCCQAIGTFEDDYITVNLSSPSDTFKLQVITDVIQFKNATETVIALSDIPGRAPLPGDFLCFKKAHNDRLAINLSYTNTAAIPDTTALGLVAVDPAFIDISTGNVPIETFSPEAVLFNGWLPLQLGGYDATSSLAHFPDAATEIRVTSAVSGQAVGRLYSDGSLNEPIKFEWDPTFFNEYLPLNASANLVTYNSYLNENVSVCIDEHLSFSESGGILLEDAMFNDAVRVSIAEMHDWSIDLNRFENMAAVVKDGPFVRFLPGYDNLPLDAEDALGLDASSLIAARGQYDTGAPLVDHYLRAQYLQSLAVRSPTEQQELSTLIALVVDYLNPVGGLAATSLPNFLAALDNDPYNVTTIKPTFGVPTVGLGIDITVNAGIDKDKKPNQLANASVTEALSMMAVDAAVPYDAAGFDVGGFDAEQQSTAFLLAMSLPPVPAPPLPATYEELFTPLHVATPSRQVEITFVSTPAVTPTFRIWTPGAPAPIVVPVVEVLSARKFRFSLSAETEAKVIAT